MKTRGHTRAGHRRASAHGAASEAVRLVREMAGAGAPGAGDAVPAGELAGWVEVSEMLAALDLDAHSIAAGLACLLVQRDAAGLDAARAHLGDEAAGLLEGLLRFDELRSIRAEDAAPAGREARAERLRKLLLAVVDDVRILIVQLALTLHRLRTARSLPLAARERLAREGLELYAPLASRLGIWQYKWEIEDLAFRESDPETYKAIAGQLDERRVDRERYVENVVRRVGAELRSAGIDAEVTGRAKHIHSIWRKMRRKSLGIEQAGIEKLFDLRAIRVLVDTVAECYTALGAVHGLWTHIPREFDDYVTNPKPNGYRSLHTAVVGPGGRTVEVQIRTREMHRQAELGVAAHWRYKEGARRAEPGLDTRISWLRQLLETGEEAGEAGSPLASLGKALESERVYAFTPRGDIVDLPAGSTPLDFAYQIHTQVGHRCRGAKVDGRIVPLTYTVRSGDRIEVLTTRHPRPSRDWLNPNLGYLGAARSRAKVRHWLKHQDRERNVADGQEIWDRELKRLGVAHPPREALAERFNASRFEDFLAALGRGGRERAPARGRAPAVSAGAPAARAEACEAAPEAHRGRAHRRRRRSAHPDGAVLPAAAERSHRGLHHPGTRRERPPRGLPQHARAGRSGPCASDRRGVERRGGGELSGGHRGRGLGPPGSAARRDLRGVERGREHRGDRVAYRRARPHGRHAHHRRGARRGAAQPHARPARAARQRDRLPAAGVTARRSSVPAPEARSSRRRCGIIGFGTGFGRIPAHGSTRYSL